MDEHKHSPQEYAPLLSNKVLYTVFRTTDRRRTDVSWFVGCQNSSNFKLEQRAGGGGGGAARLFLCSFFPCSADHERDWPPCKVVFFGLATSALNVRNNKTGDDGCTGASASSFG